MQGSCKFCRRSQSNVKSFLLTCSCCRVSWHHNCHAPAVSSRELIVLIKASNSGDPSRGIESWTCNKCVNQRISAATKDVITIDDSDDDILIIAETLTLPHPQRKAIMDLTMSDDDAVAVEIVDNSPIVIDSDPAPIQGPPPFCPPSRDKQQQFFRQTDHSAVSQRPTSNGSPVNPFMEWLNMDKMSPFAVETERIWSTRKVITRPVQRPRKAVARKLDSAAKDGFCFTNR